VVVPQVVEPNTRHAEGEERRPPEPLAEAPLPMRRRAVTEHEVVRAHALHVGGEAEAKVGAQAVDRAVTRLALRRIDGDDPGDLLTSLLHVRSAAR
jgi:hypothetical protein